MSCVLLARDLRYRYPDGREACAGIAAWVAHFYRNEREMAWPTCFTARFYFSRIASTGTSRAASRSLERRRASNQRPDKVLAPAYAAG